MYHGWKVPNRTLGWAGEALLHRGRLDCRYYYSGGDFADDATRNQLPMGQGEYRGDDQSQQIEESIAERIRQNGNPSAPGNPDDLQQCVPTDMKDNLRGVLCAGDNSASPHWIGDAMPRVDNHLLGIQKKAGKWRAFGGGGGGDGGGVAEIRRYAPTDICKTFGVRASDS